MALGSWFRTPMAPSVREAADIIGNTTRKDKSTQEELDDILEEFDSD